jgi:hypothetical protein
MELSYEKAEQQFVAADNECASMKVHTHMLTYYKLCS